MHFIEQIFAQHELCIFIDSSVCIGYQRGILVCTDIAYRYTLHSEFRKSILVVPKCQQKWLFQRTTTTAATEHGMNELEKKSY